MQKRHFSVEDFIGLANATALIIASRHSLPPAATSVKKNTL
jgi:hypothetical protein